MLLAICTAANAQTKYSFRGKLGRDISFRLDLEQNKEGIIAGETTYYRKNGKIAKLRVLGHYNSAKNSGYDTPTLWLTEFDGIKHCGYFNVILSGSTAVGGTWTYMDKELNINSLEKTIYPAGKVYLHPAKGPAINGEYRFKYSRSIGYGDCGGSCTLSYVNGKVHYSICTVTPNIADEEKTVTPIGSYFSASHGACRYKGYIDRNFVFIRTTNNVTVDDWGAHASIDGFYVKH